MNISSKLGPIIEGYFLVIVNLIPVNLYRRAEICVTNATEKKMFIKKYTNRI